MSDTTVTTEAPLLTPPPQAPLPNDQAARSLTGEILEPSQIKPATPTPSEAKPELKPDGTPVETSTSKPEAKPEAKPEPGKAPDTYAAFTAPDGYTIDPKTIEAATPIFKEMGLDQASAQRLVDFHTQQMITAAKAPQDAFEATRTEWQAKVKSDPDLLAAVNGDKTGLDAVKLDIGRALNALNDPALTADFKAAMNDTGVGDHPAFVKAMWKLSQFITEGKHVAGTQPSPHGQRAPGTNERPAPAKALYPNLS